MRPLNKPLVQGPFCQPRHPQAHFPWRQLGRVWAGGAAPSCPILTQTLPIQPLPGHCCPLAEALGSKGGFCNGQPFPQLGFFPQHHTSPCSIRASGVVALPSPTPPLWSFLTSGSHSLHHSHEGTSDPSSSFSELNKSCPYC